MDIEVSHQRPSPGIPGWRISKLKEMHTRILLLFPSQLNHAVEENQNEEERVSLAFNLQSLPLVLDAPEDAFRHF